MPLKGDSGKKKRRHAKPKSFTARKLRSYALIAVLLVISACASAGLLASQQSNLTVTTTVCGIDRAYDGYNGWIVFASSEYDYFTPRQLKSGVTYQLDLTDGYDPHTSITPHYQVRDIISATVAPVQQHHVCPVSSRPISHTGSSAH